jgi:hypothetical protein
VCAARSNPLRTAQNYCQTFWANTDVSPRALRRFAAADAMRPARTDLPARGVNPPSSVGLGTKGSLRLAPGGASGAATPRMPITGIACCARGATPSDVDCHATPPAPECQWSLPQPTRSRPHMALRALAKKRTMLLHCENLEPPQVSVGSFASIALRTRVCLSLTSDMSGGCQLRSGVVELLFLSCGSNTKRNKKRHFVESDLFSWA